MKVGSLPFVKIGNRTLIRHDDLDHLLRSTPPVHVH
nr:hypothetical protein [Sphingomonas bacterium]